MKKLTWIFLLLVLPCFSQGTSSSPIGRFGAVLSSWCPPITLLVTVVIAVVYYLQLKAMREAVDEARKASDASRDSADAAKQAFLTTHRPRIAVKFMWIQGMEHMSQGLSGQFRVFNSGETKAILQSYYSNIIILPTLPAMAPLQEDGHEFTGELLPGEFTQGHLPTGGVKTVNFQELNALRNRIEDVRKHGKDTESNPHNLFVVGWIKYLDEGKVPRTVGFCKKYNFATHRFEREADEDYEYGDHDCKSGLGR
jgi:hypothetical protein